MPDISLTLTYPDAATAIAVGRSICTERIDLLNDYVPGGVIQEDINQASAAKLAKGVEIIFQAIAEEMHRRQSERAAIAQHVEPIRSGSNVGTVDEDFS